MTSPNDRRRLRAAYETRPADAGVYAIRNRVTEWTFVRSSTNLTAIRNRFEFGRTMGTPNALDAKVAEQAREYGYDALEFEVVDRLEVTPAMSEREIADALRTLEELWREQLRATAEAS
jgi:hypothetical protein